MLIDEFLAPAEHGVRLPGQHMGRAAEQRRHNLHGKLRAQQPGDFIDQLPERAVVLGPELPVPLARGFDFGGGRRQAGIEHAVRASVADHRIERDRADGDHDLGFQEFLGQINPLAADRGGQITAIVLGRRGMHHGNHLRMRQNLGSLQKRRSRSRGGLEQGHVLGADAGFFQVGPDAGEQFLRLGRFAVEGQNDAVVGNHRPRERRIIQRARQRLPKLARQIRMGPGAGSHFDNPRGIDLAGKLFSGSIRNAHHPQIRQRHKQPFP